MGARELVQRVQADLAAQGLPLRLEDPSLIAAVASILGPVGPQEHRSRPGGRPRRDAGHVEGDRSDSHGHGLAS
jgi:hypothetical protein